MRRGKILAAVVTVLAVLAMLPFAASAEEPVKNGWYSDKGYYEYFQDGYQCKNGEHYISESNAYFRFDSEGRMYENEWYRDPETNNWYYYKAGGFRATDCVQAINGYYYGFAYNGVMYDDTDFSLYSYETGNWNHYRATAGGPLVVSRWIYTEDSKYEQGGYYKYYGADGAAYRGIQQVDGVYYHFYDDGQMSTEGSRSIYDGKTESYRDIRAKAGGALFRNEWYQDQWDNWYYYGDDCFAPQGLTTIGSATYYFFWDGRMMTNQTYYDGSCSYDADKNGSAVRLNPNTWTLIGKDYYYCVDGQVLSHQIATIGNSNYYFDYSGKMLNDETRSLWDDGISYDIRAHAGGSLYCGEWYLDEWGGYTYYGYDCKRVEDGFVELGNSLFYFRNGYAAQNEMFETEDGIYVAASDCAVTRQYDGWLNFKNRFYYVSGNQLVRNCIMEIGGSKYAFNSEGCMYEDGIYWINDSEYDNSCYLITDSGAIVTEQGWKQYYGEWYYVTGDATLYQGLLKLGENMYYLSPSMEYSTFSLAEDGNLYLVSPSGLYQKITTDGYYNIGFGKVLVENGKLFNGWKQVDGVWYYYDPVMLAGDYYYIDDDACYYFDNNGIMKANGWIPYETSYLYADESGRLADGIVNIDGTTYLFNGYSLSYDNYYTDNGTAYVSDSEAHATQIEYNGWSSANGYWYYTEDGYVQIGNLSLEDGYYFLDYETGRMISNTEYNNSYYDASGRRYTGWKQFDGYWYYFDNYYKASDGVYNIDGKRYCFNSEGKMLTNTTYYSKWENRMYVVDASGIVSDDYTVPEGIVYYNGNAYMPDYDGWYGDYYFSGGKMVIDGVINDNGTYYYLDINGKYIRNGWYRDADGYYNWLYADASGKLCYNEWAYIDNSWYYFDYIHILSDGIYYISADERYAEFDANGRFLGYVENNSGLPTGTPNTWEYIGGKYRYYNSTGTTVKDTTLYIDGHWYAFDYDGYMLSNEFYYNDYYYTASGARLETPNQWQMIDGNWYYFGPDSSAVFGWIDIYGTRYYVSPGFYFSDTTETASLGMLTGYHLIDGKVYYFYENGACYGEYVGDGWLQLADGYYVYFKDGKLLNDGIYTIYGVKYYFYRNGTLLTDGCGRDSSTNSYVIASASGALYDAGWHYTDKGWVYIDEYGSPCINGVYEIDGVVYFFYDGYMI